MSMLFMQRSAVALIMALWLSGCANLSPAPTTDAPRPVRSYADTLDLNGRISVRYQNNGKDEALHGSFLWAQTPSTTNVTLLSPLGQTVAIINVAPSGATLMQGGQSPRVAADVDGLVESALGWPLPIAGLRDWLQGFAADASGKPFTAAPQTSEVVTRDGWRIHYASWQDDTQNRPKRINLERHTAQAGDVSIRIVIDTWQ